MPIGIIRPSSIAGITPHEQVGYLTHPLSVVMGLYEGTIPHICGDFKDENPVSLQSTAYTGFIEYSFFNDFYNRIFVLPSTVDYGSIGGDTTIPVSIWNAYLHEITLESISGIDVTGISVIGKSRPLLFPPLGINTYLFTAGTSGPANINGSFTFDFGGELYLMPILGVRAALVQFEPNWDRPYDVQHSYKTDIVQASAGREQRRSLREHPRLSVEFKLQRHDHQLQKFLEIMYGQHNNQVLLPDFSRTTRLTIPLISGTVTATVDSPTAWLVPNAGVVLYLQGRTESRTIKSIVGNTLTFTGSGPNDFPEGSKIYPAFAGIMSDTINSDRYTHTVSEATFSMDVVPGSEKFLEVPIATEFFDGVELFAYKPNWRDSPNISFKSERQTVDYGRGRTQIFTPHPFTNRTMRLTYNGLNTKRSELLINFFKRQKGKLGQFYIPSFDNDIEAKDTILNNTNFIRIKGRTFLNTFGGSATHRAYIINLKDGSKIYRKIESIYSVSDPSGDDTIIEATVIWTSEIPLTDIASISWLFLSRFATDDLTVSWLTDEISDIQMTTQLLENIL